MVVSHGQMVSTDANPIQIDEARLAERRKLYNRSRMLNGNYAPLSENSNAYIKNNTNHD